MIIENTKEDTRVVKCTTYTCSDGKTFTCKDNAENYEKYLNAKEIVKNLKYRTEDFVGFEKYYDIAYYCSSKEEFDAVCIVMKYENINLRYADDDLYIVYDSETYKDEGWYYFKVREDYVDDYNYNWGIFICSLNTKRNNTQKRFDKAKKELDVFNEKYSQYIDDLYKVTSVTQREQEIQADAIREFAEWCKIKGYGCYDWRMLIEQYEKEQSMRTEKGIN